VDVGSETLDARIGQAGQARRFANTAEGIADLIAFCRTQQVALAVMEATGGYERPVFAQLWAAELPAAVVNPRSVRCFAEAMGRLEKTDSIDAGMIAWYAQTKRIKPTPPAPATQQRLAALVVRLRQLTELRVAQTNQRRLVAEPDALASFEAVLAAVASQTRILEAKIAEAVAADPLWAKLDAAFREVKGVADRTVARIMAELPEIGALSGKAVAKLAGLAPLANDSGKHKGGRSIRGGREGVRSILFTVAEVVRRHDPDFRDFHQRLSAAGKPKKVIRVALAHKLLVRLNAKARDVRNELAGPA
jgi:transposase